MSATNVGQEQKGQGAGSQDRRGTAGTGRAQRDMSKAQFLSRAAAYGWKPAGFMGYFRRELPDGGAVSVSVWNAGDRRRSQLAYLIAAGEKHEREAEKRAADRLAAALTEAR
jgi:hypothetical protein